MRIVHVANFYGPNSGGIKTTLHELGRGYLKYGHDFIYIVPGTQFSSEVTPFGRKISLPSFILPGSGSYRIIRSNKALRELIKELNPDRLEISDRFTLRSLGIWAKTQGIPSVVFSHETLRGLAKRFLPAFFPRNLMVNWHNRRLARSFDHVVATTDFAAEEFVEIGAKNLVKIPLGVDLENFSPARRSMDLRAELAQGADLLLVHCGRLSPEKEPQRSIEALVELEKRGIKTRLIIVGTGPMWKKMSKLAKGLPVEMLGYVSGREKVAAILASADFSMAPGPLETFCLSALESIASGTPVIASESSAVGEFLGLAKKIPAGAVAADNGKSFADAIERLMQISGVDISARAAAEQLSWDQTINFMLALHGIESIGHLAPTASTKRKITAA
jgi:alpha-1,6-mannosyltransferase